MPKAALVLFDLDGTLVDSAPDIAHAANAALAAVGLPPRSEAEIRSFIGNGAERLMHRCLSGHRDRDAADSMHRAAYAAFQTAYAGALSVRTRVFPGVTESLETLRAAGIPVGCITNKPVRFTHPLLADLNLARYFSVILGGDSLPTRKPDPAPLLEAARRCGVTPMDCVMVGDSMADLSAARAAGMRIFCVSYGYSAGIDLSAQGPDACADDLRAFLPLWLPA